MESNNQIPIEVVKELCRQAEMWELDNPRVIAMLDNIFKCINDEGNLNDESKETFEEFCEKSAPKFIQILLNVKSIFSRYFPCNNS